VRPDGAEHLPEGSGVADTPTAGRSVGRTLEDDRVDRAGQGVLQQGDEALAGTRHAARARVSAATAAEAGVKDGDLLAVTGPAGTVALPLEITVMPDRVVWLPLNSTGRGVASDSGATPGSLVRIGPATLTADAPKEVEE